MATDLIGIDKSLMPLVMLAFGSGAMLGNHFGGRLADRFGGKQTVKESLLPIQQSLVVGNKEYRFTVAAGERSFMSVTSDSCDYP